VAWIAVGVLALTVVGLSVALASVSSSSTPTSPQFGRAGPGFGGRFGGPGAFGGNSANLGVAGTVASVASSSFTVTDRSGQVVTVDEQSSTTYYNGITGASSSAVVKGARVLVQGTRNDNTVTATRVDVLSARGFAAPSS
jgi:hypothetical protein